MRSGTNSPAGSQAAVNQVQTQVAPEVVHDVAKVSVAAPVVVVVVRTAVVVAAHVFY